MRKVLLKFKVSYSVWTSYFKNTSGNSDLSSIEIRSLRSSLEIRALKSNNNFISETELFD